jgi:hypothetical protein
MSDNKSTEQLFVQDWTATAKWAQTNNIPKVALQSVYQTDVNRLAQYGEPMSNAERYTEIMAAAGHAPIKQTPSAGHPWWDVPANLGSDISNITTSLISPSTWENIFDSVTRSVIQPIVGGIEHTLTGKKVNYGPAVQTLEDLPGVFTVKGRKKLGQDLANPQNAFSSLVPGVADIGTVFRADPSLSHATGFEALMQHPLASSLDIMPDLGGALHGLASMSDELGSGALSARLADATGLSKEAFQHAGILRLAGRAVTHHDAFDWMARDGDYSMLTRTPSGDAELTRGTIGDTIRRAIKAKGKGYTGRFASDAGAALTTRLEEASRVLDEAMAPMIEAAAPLTDQQRAAALILIQTSGQDIDELVANPRVDPSLKPLINSVQPLQDYLAKAKLSSGDLAEFEHPNGRLEVYRTNVAEALKRARTKAETSMGKLNHANAEANTLADDIAKGTTQARSFMAGFANFKTRLWDALGPSLSQDAPTGDLSNLLERNVDDRLHVRRKEPIYTEPGAAAAAHDLGMPEEHWVTRSLGQHHVNTLTRLMGPGGLVDQAAAAMEAENWTAFRDLAGKINRAMHSSSAQEIAIDSGRGLLSNLTHVSEQLYAFAKWRMTQERKLDDIWLRGTKGRAAMRDLVRAAQKDQSDFERLVRSNLPPAAIPMYQSLFLQHLADDETRTRIVGEMEAQMRDVTDAQGKRVYTDAYLDALRSDPARLQQAVEVFVESTYDDPMLGQANASTVTHVRNSALAELDTLYRTRDPATGLGPHFGYVPNQLKDLDKWNVADRTINIDPTRILRASSGYERLLDMTPSINNIVAQFDTAVKNQLAEDVAREFQENFVLKQTYRKDQVLNMAQLLHASRATFDPKGIGASFGVDLNQIIEKDFNLVAYDPESIFGIKPASINSDPSTRLIDADHVRSLQLLTNVQHGPISRVVTSGTRLFKTAILGYSPRFDAHILFGGSAFLAFDDLRNFARIGDAYRELKALRDGEPSRLAHEQFPHSSTQEGNEDAGYFHLQGKTLRRLQIEERLGRNGLTRTTARAADIVKAGADYNFRFTRWVTNMQRAMVILNHLDKIERQGYFLDEAGNRVEATLPAAQEEAARAANRVMGDTRRMTPLERSIANTVMPFYGWTRHVLKFLAELPVDHPYRAMFLANFAEITAEQENASNLNIRFQFLFAPLGTNSSGEETAFDTRFLNPFRDVGDYTQFSSLESFFAGWAGSLNPAIAAPLSAINPEFSYGGNELYPTLTYNDLYGESQAGPQGSAWNILEQYIPESSALQDVLTQSANLRSLWATNKSAFAEQIAEALNVPMVVPQSISIPAEKAHVEQEQFDVAKAAAENAWSTGDFSGLSQWTTVPYPGNDTYFVTPAQLQALYNAAQAQGGTQTLAEPQDNPAVPH